MSDGKIKHDFYQTDAHVTVEIRVKGLKAEDVNVDFSEQSLTVTAKLPVEGNKEFKLDIDPLFAEIHPQQSSYKVKRVHLT